MISPGTKSPTALSLLLTLLLTGCGGASSGSSDQGSGETTTTGNQRPSAQITALQEFLSGHTVSLDGSGSSDPDGDSLSYHWTQTEGPSIALNGGTTATVSFMVPDVTQATQYAFELTVDDGALTSTTSLSFQLLPPPPTVNQQPVAMIIVSPQSITSGEQVTLDGSSSTDPDGDNLGYQWQQIAGPDISLPGSQNASLSFTAPQVSQPTSYTFQLTVSDGSLSSQASMSFQVSPPASSNHAPHASISAPQTAVSGETVTLDGSASSDTDGDTLSYYWEQTQGEQISLGSNSNSTLSFVAPTLAQSSVLAFRLTVNDGALTHQATAQVTISPSSSNTSQCTDGDLFCENFESFTGTSATSSEWSIESNAATASIDNTHAFGNRALHLATTNNGMAFLVPNTFSPQGNSFYGRMRLWVDAFPTQPDYAHFTMVEASGSNSGTLVRPVGGQYIPGKANDTPLWGVGSDGGSTGDWTAWQETTPTAGGQWICMEWQMDASNNAVNIWIDGVAKPELSVSTHDYGTQYTDTTNAFTFPSFNKIRLGWQLYQGGSTPPNFDIWLDDLALGSTRVGCSQ